MLGGRAIAITGVRGGVGATTIAVNLSWHFGVGMRRHTVLLDPDPHLGMRGVPAEHPARAGSAHGAGIAGTYRRAAGRTRRAAGGRPAACSGGEEKIALQPNHAPGAGRPAADGIAQPV